MIDLPESEDRPTPAGVYDAALGGTTNTAADRAMVEHARSKMPHVIEGAWANRGFLQRAVKTMATEWGIRQFIDLGSGVPTQRNTHEVLAEVRPDGHVVYVDISPSVVQVATGLLAGQPNAAAVLADIRHPELVLDHPATRRLIDFSEPIGLLMVAVTHFMSDADDPWGVAARYIAALPSGSYFALSSVTADHQEETWSAVLEPGRPKGYEGYPRTRAEVARFFDGLEIIPPYPGAAPAVEYIGMWGAEDPGLADDDSSRLAYAAVARKP